MRQIFIIAIVVLCLPAISIGAGNGQIDFRNSYGDTLWSNVAASIDIWVANSVMCGGFQLPIVLSSPDGVTWEWNSQSSGWGPSKYVTHNPLSRIHPPNTMFDLTAGILVNENYLPDRLLMGAGCMFSICVYPGPLEHWLSVHLTPSAPTDGQTYQFCLDLNQQIGPAHFGFSDYGGLEIAMTFLDDNNDGIWCWPVVVCPNGDANGDNQINIGDAVYIVTYVFRGGPAPVPLEAGDANGDSQINVGDAVYLVNYIFRNGPAPCMGSK